MKAKEIQELINFLAKSGLEKVNIETEDFKLSIKRSADQKIVATPQSVVPMTTPVTSPISKTQENVSISDDKEVTPPKEDNLIQIKSPMIGTFYRSSNPNTPVFVEVGQDVKPGDTVCIIEAMKLFNEIESEVSGKVVKILVDNTQPVEYDQPLFLLDPS